MMGVDFNIDKTWVGSRGDHDFVWATTAQGSRVLCYPRLEDRRAERLVNGWGKPQIRGLNAIWEAEAKDSTAVKSSEPSRSLGCSAKTWGAR